MPGSTSPRIWGWGTWGRYNGGPGSRWATSRYPKSPGSLDYPGRGLIPATRRLFNFFFFILIFYFILLYLLLYHPKDIPLYSIYKPLSYILILITWEPSLFGLRQREDSKVRYFRISIVLDYIVKYDRI